MGFPALELSLTLSGLREHIEVLLIDQSPRSSSACGESLSPLVFCQTNHRLPGAANIESSGALALQDIDVRHLMGVGGPGRIRTDDLPGYAGARSTGTR